MLNLCPGIFVSIIISILFFSYLYVLMEVQALWYLQTYFNIHILRIITIY
jgi:hypothetical protein